MSGYSMGSSTVSTDGSFQMMGSGSFEDVSCLSTKHIKSKFSYVLTVSFIQLLRIITQYCMYINFMIGTVNAAI